MDGPVLQPIEGAARGGGDALHDPRMGQHRGGPKAQGGEGALGPQVGTQGGYGPGAVLPGRQTGQQKVGALAGVAAVVEAAAGGGQAPALRQARGPFISLT